MYVKKAGESGMGLISIIMKAGEINTEWYFLTMD